MFAAIWIKLKKQKNISTAPKAKPNKCYLRFFFSL